MNKIIFVLKAFIQGLFFTWSLSVGAVNEGYLTILNVE